MSAILWWFVTKLAYIKVLTLLSAQLVGAQPPDRVALWEDGEYRYKTFTAVIGHAGSCQPDCTEKRTVLVPPNVFYKVKVEVAQVDMHSSGEFVVIKVGKQQVKCSPSVASDYNCSLTECDQISIGSVAGSVLQVEAVATRTRDTCKCALGPEGRVDCYSELLSGLDSTYGMLARLTFIPQVQAAWVTGPWSQCSQPECQASSSSSNRSVQCRIFDPDDMGDGGDRCPLPVPISARPCLEAPECTPPPRCDACFSVVHLQNSQGLGLDWNAIAITTPQERDRVAVDLANRGKPLSVELLPGLAKTSCSATLQVNSQDATMPSACVSLALCSNSSILLRRPEADQGAASSFRGLVLESEPDSDDDMSWHQFRMAATFHLYKVSTAGYLLANPYSEHGAGSQKPFAAVLGLPKTVSSDAERNQMKKNSATCSLRMDELIPPKVACEVSSTERFCPDVSVGRLGRCCQKNSCHPEAEEASCPSGNGVPGISLVSKGSCEEVGCSAIEERTECEAAAASLGLKGNGGTTAVAQLRLSSTLPASCSWEPATADNGSPALWLNKKGGASATSAISQLCRCRGSWSSRSYAWSVSDWGSCSRTCGKQQRVRDVICLVHAGEDSADEGHEVPATRCREAGLTEPPSSEPCSTPSCWAAEVHTRCAGKDRPLHSSDVGQGMWLVTNGNGTGTPHCMAMNISLLFRASITSADGVNVDLTAAEDQCRQICSRMGNCVGFTLYDHVFGDWTLAQCCFLRRATRWQANFRRATCHLSQGAQTRNGCACQVGWAVAEGSGNDEVCGATRQGCCATPDSGARSWCPTTSPSCGTKLLQQQHWDLCDPTGVAVVSEHTCRSHPNLFGNSCASARGISECNQIATVLGLPDTTPVLTLSMQMPSGCVWQRATSQLWLNQLVDAVNASDPSQKVAMSASQEFAELCSCPRLENFHWEVGEWRPCYQDFEKCHGARVRTRHVFCVRRDIRSNEVVSDSSCHAVAGLQRPEQQETCSSCDRQVLAASAQFNMVAGLEVKDTLAFSQTCLENLAMAAGLSHANRMSLGKVNCCEDATLSAEVLVSDGDPGEVTAATALERLVHISRSAHARSMVQWTSNFAPFTQFLSMKILGSYSWSISDRWGQCSRGCGGGLEVRDVWCQFSDFELLQKEVPDMNCHATSRPAGQRSCASQTCNSCPAFVVGPQYAVSGGNTQMVHESKVYVTCAAGYATVDDVMLVESECQDGAWTPLAVSCGRNCPDFETASWKYEVRGSGTRHGSTRQVTCLRGEDSSLVEAPPSASVICQDGTWTKPMLACTGDCQSPELSSAYAISMNSSKGEDQSGSIAQKGSIWYISCAEGFNSSEGLASVRLECVEGSWTGLDDIPDCNANCPRYTLNEGYEVESDLESDAAVTWSSDSPPPTGGGTGTAMGSTGLESRLLQDNSSGVPHRTSIGIRCVNGYGRMPGAVEHVVCNDGQWSPLSLVCKKDCKPFNASSLDHSRFRIIMDMSRPNKNATALADVPHGSKVIVGCQLDTNLSDPDEKHKAIRSERASKRGEVTCDNGNWMSSDLRCFNDCPAFVPGQEYSVLIPGVHQAQEASPRLPHGTQLLATCARGFSPPAAGAINSLAEANSSDIPATGTLSSTPRGDALIVEAECVDGAWTNLDLQCFPDCQPLQTQEHFVVDGGGGLRAGSLLHLACVNGREQGIWIRCGRAGAWEMAFDVMDWERERLVRPGSRRHEAEKEQEQPTSGSEPLNLETVSMVCPQAASPTAPPPRRDLTLWGKLSDDERAMFMMLVLGCFGSLCGLACTYMLSPFATSDRREDLEEEDIDSEQQKAGEAGVAVDDDAGRRFNLLTGELERREGNARKRRRRNRRRPSSRLHWLVQEAAQTVSEMKDWTMEALDMASGPAPLCQMTGCLMTATHVCFPCCHLCLCSACAQNFNTTRGIGEQVTCPFRLEHRPCGQKVLCVVDAQPSELFQKPGPVHLVLNAASAAASTLRRSASSVAQDAADAAARHAPALPPTLMGRSRSEAARRAANAPPNWRSHE